MKMKSCKSALCVALLLLLASGLFAQGTFQNLDFEHPSLPLSPSGPLNYVPATNALPFWTVYFGTDTFDQVRYNQVSIGGVAVSLLDTNYGVILQGNFTAVLSSGLDAAANQQKSAAIGQAGTIPPGARSVRFVVLQFVNGRVDTSFAGQTLSLEPLAIIPTGPSTELVEYGADVTSLGGHSGELRFASSVVPGFANDLYLDNIRFSDLPIPEPQVGWMMILGMLVIAHRRLKRL